MERSAHSAKENVAAAPGAAGPHCDAALIGRELVRAALTLHQCWSRPFERFVFARCPLRQALGAIASRHVRD